MRMKYLLALIVIMCPLIGFSQDIPSEEIIDKGIELYDQGKYQDAIKEFMLISENDSNYVWSLYELALCYNATREYDLFFNICDRALEENTGHTPGILNLMANVYDDDGQFDKALELYDKALELTPYNYNIYYNLGIACQNQGNTEEAAGYYMEAIRCNPFHASSHLALGKIASAQGHFTQAILALETFLLIEPASSRSNGALVFLENLSNNYLDTSYVDIIEPFMDNYDFAYTDHLIRAKISLRQDLQADIDFKASFINQTEMLFEVLDFNDMAKGFWSDVYFPFFMSVKDNNYFQPMIYHILTSTNNETVKKWTEKNTDLLKNFFSLGTRLNNVRLYKRFGTGEKEEVFRCEYNENGTLLSIGNRNSEEKENGYWKLFNNNGTLSAEGLFIDGLKEGLWTNYYYNGIKARTETYSGGLLSGQYKEFGNNGNLIVELVFKDGNPEGTVRYYYDCGAVREETQYKAGIPEGPSVSYYPKGDTAGFSNYSEGLLDGKLIEFFPDGRLMSSSNYEKGIADGDFRSYIYNGQPGIIGSYSEGKENGEWINFYPDGRIASKSYFEKGIKTGKWTEYWNNGNISSETNYSGGEPVENKTYYNESGKPIRTETWSGGKVVAVATLGEDGKTISKAGSPNGTFSFELSREGEIRWMTGEYLDGMKNGIWTTYWINGNKRIENSFIKDNYDGPSREYYINGKLKKEEFYSENIAEGIASKYHLSGELSETSNYINGLLEGHAKTYYPDGIAETEMYYENGEINGWYSIYGPEGKVSIKNRYTKGKLVRHITYNRDGVKLNDLDFKDDDKMIIMNGAGGTEAECPVICNQMEGEFTWYYPGGNIMTRRYFEAGIGQGEYNSYFRTGEVRAKSYFLNNSQYGNYSLYYRDGKPEFTGNLINDQRDSLWTSYYETGNVKSVASYLADDEHGTTTFWDENGVMAVKLHFVYGELTGYQYMKKSGISEVIGILDGSSKIVAYYHDGSLSFEMERKDYLKDGHWRLYSSSGHLLDERYYKEGLVEGKSVEYYSDGKLMTEENYRMGERDGITKTFRKDGSIESEQSFKYGELNGPSKFFNKNSEVIISEIYWANILHEKIL